MDKRCPCTRDCPNRNAECHIYCEAYKEYAKIKEEEYAERAKAYNDASNSYDLYYKRLKRAGITIRTQ